MATTNDWDWNEMEKSAGGNFSPIADAGFYKVKVESIGLRETKNTQGGTTYWMDFVFVDDGTKYPKVSHSISFKNDAWRRVHFMRILKEFGISEDKAKQAIKAAEAKSGVDNIVSAYVTVFDRATAKNPEIEIEVYESNVINPNSGRPYMRADFKNKAIAFGRGNNKPAPAKQESILDEGEEIVLDDSETIPFI